MPFILIDDTDARGILPPGVTEDDVTKLEAEALAQRLTELVQEALRPHLYALTGNMDYAPEEAPEQPRRKK